MKSSSPRVATAQRNQLEMRTFDLDSTLGSDHVARAIWAVVDRLDLSAFYAEIKARGAAPGRSATDPKILLCLWLYATTQGVGSGREVDRLCGTDDAYRWICGGVALNYHTLNDFRVEHGSKLDDLLVQVLGAMSNQGLVRLERVAQDGMRVRADAGAASFRREETLREHQAAARQQVERLRKELTDDPAAYQRMRQAAQVRAAEVRASAIDRALAEMPAVIEVKRRNRGRKTKSGKKSEPRVSTTDPESRVMKMADGGFRPAYNVQLATDTESRVIVGIGISNRGTDVPLMVPMLDDIARRTGRRPGEYLVDGGFVNLDGFTEAAQRGITVYAPEMRTRGETPSQEHRRRDTPEVAQWRSRMKRTDSRSIYKLRAATAETVNADLRTWRSLDRIPIRGLAKARCHVLLNALTYNLARWRALTAA
jgi:transposase